MANVLLIHGAYGNPGENWLPWIKNELEKAGHIVYVPQFPTPEHQSLENWFSVFEDYQQYLNTESIIVGHSIGVGFILNVLEQKETPIKASFLVAGWVGLLNLEIDAINKTFIDRDFNWEKIKTNCKQFVILNSDNDPYVPLELSQHMAQQLGTPVTLVAGAGHFNEKAGFIEFPLLLEKINEVI